MKKPLWSAAALLLLLAAVTAQFWGAMLLPRSGLRTRKLTEEIPTQLPGWMSRAISIAETEELKKNTELILQFDDVFTCGYSSGGRELTLYVAYWKPGKVPPRSVGVHTPDTCWVQNGWSRLSRDYAVPLAAASGPLLPAERGVYAMHDTVLHVLFWHLVGKRPYSYRQNGLHALASPFQDFWSFGLRQRQAQLFVRLASNQPFEQIWDDPGFQKLLEALGKIGIASPVQKTD